MPAATLDERIEVQRNRLFDVAGVISCARVAAEDLEQVPGSGPPPDVSVTLGIVIDNDPRRLRAA